MSRVIKSVVLWLAAIIVIAPISEAIEITLHTERSLYRNIIVYESNDERCMRFTRQISSRQTCISLINPNQLVFNCTKMVLGSLYLQPQPQKILIIGLGGGTLPTVLSQVFPKAVIDSVEIDPAVVRVAHKFFNFQLTPNTHVFEEDGRVFVRRAIREGKKYDLVILDAYDHQYIPEHLLTREFLNETKKVMTLEGVLAANTFSASRLYDHESTTYESVFGQFFNLRKKDNRIILIKNNGLPSVDSIKKNAEALEPLLLPYGAGSAYLLPLFSTERDWRVDARVLTDEYSPSNLLNLLFR
ncbi:MAG: fused MFS/spermidine synthase [Desulfobacterales bacterium]|nr:fused MFS/spermidine synthase [Desulfobacterales bacterium]